MKDLQTLARPYAKALFELALESHTFDFWKRVLTGWSLVIDEPQMSQLLRDPFLNLELIVDILLTVLQKSVSNLELDLLRRTLFVMAGRGRLQLIPEIYRQFEHLYANYIQTYMGIVYTSIVLDGKQLKKLEAGLKKKLNKTIYLSQVEDPSLLGGAKIQIGDMVIDGSLKGRIQRLRQALFM